jgi:hypothetical protein
MLTYNKESAILGEEPNKKANTDLLGRGGISSRSGEKELNAGNTINPTKVLPYYLR